MMFPSSFSYFSIGRPFVPRMPEKKPFRLTGLQTFKLVDADTRSYETKMLFSGSSNLTNPALIQPCAISGKGPSAGARCSAFPQQPYSASPPYSVSGCGWRAKPAAAARRLQGGARLPVRPGPAGGTSLLPPAALAKEGALCASRSCPLKTCS